MTRKHVVTVTATDCRTGWIFKCSCGMRFIVRQRSVALSIAARHKREHESETEF